MANRDIVAIGTSAGGVEALQLLAAQFSSDFPATVLVTMHLGDKRSSVLAEILSRAGAFKASFAVEDAPLTRGRILIAPPGRHLIVEADKVVLGIGPRENNARPAIDPMLRSAAVCCTSRVIGVVLTGTLGDGAAGLSAVSKCGGIAIVQDPNDAAFPEMPLNALNRSMPHHVVSLAAMPELLERLVRHAASEPMPVPEEMKFEVLIAKDGRPHIKSMDRVGKRSVLTCPECNGVFVGNRGQRFNPISMSRWSRVFGGNDDSRA